MIKPNWDIFRAKFSENHQNNFEWYCYILFCKEFKREKGIFRFKNQSATETNPIKHEKDIVGWQAKFFDTSLSQHKDEILETLEKAKRDYPEITKIIFYTNKEWSQSKGEPPKGKTETEAKAKELNIILEWRCSSYFESPFVAVDNENISRHFFENNKSIFNLIKELNSHTENIFTRIKTNIAFENQVIEIDRNIKMSEIQDSKQQIIILSGAGGTGKTALIKQMYEAIKENSPFYLFKATEFELSNINNIFKDYDLDCFIKTHKEEKYKVIVIDSAEKILDLKNTDPFKEFLSVVIADKWKIIFTTRDNYVYVLNTDFFEIYNIAPVNIPLENLSKDQLQNLSDNHSFKLPKDEKLLKLIKNPFYLSEYLKYYKTDDELNYEEFKRKLWKRNITKTSPPRSECFQMIALLRSNVGSFFVTPDCESSIINELVRDGILGYEDDRGYFITHDIYEEWALEKIIKRNFLKKESNQKFFNEIGQSLPIRRSFRNWISEQLLLENSGVKNFIEEVICDNDVFQSWQNEILVSILLSDYSDYFFSSFKDLLLGKNQELLKRATFWLRIACKEIDDDFFKQLGIKSVDLSTLKYVLTKPKGNGWKSIIKFVYSNLETIGIENIHFILPVIGDWNGKFKKGNTTRFSSLTALQYYQWITEKDVYFSRDDDVREKLFQTILYGSAEIKEELIAIFEEILNNKWKSHRDPYYDLSKTILTKLEGFPASEVLPEYVIQLADLFWTHTPKNVERVFPSRKEIEEQFGIECSLYEYFPASSYQTPIYWLLQSSLRKTIDFILSFTGKSVQKYASSDFDDSVKKVEIFFQDGTTQEQYISSCLWNIYRGTSSPVSPYLLQSIHMALERFFLERGKNLKPEVLQYWLLYLLKNSNSASISAVVTSIVLAFPDKTFDVATILFQTKEFFLFDKHRQLKDLYEAKSLYSIGYGLNSRNEIYENERIKTCDDKHRQWELESQCLNYQVFRKENVSEEAVKNRKKIIWEILDNYYKEIPEESKQTEADQTWRMFLARMDFRKMNPSTSETENGIEIHWNPEIDHNLKQKGEESTRNISLRMQYASLEMWATYRIRKDKEYKEYEQYEQNPKLALSEVKELISSLQNEHSEDEMFRLVNSSIPGAVCSVLIRDFIDELNQIEISYCKDIIFEVASSSLQPSYHYQINDGVQFAISVLPRLLEKFPEEKDVIKLILLLTLFHDYSIDMAGGQFNFFSINAICNLWEISFEEAQSLLFGYLFLKPRYEIARIKLRQENFNNEIYNIGEYQLIEFFLNEHENELKKTIENNITFEDCEPLKEIGLSVLGTAFQLIPLESKYENHKSIANEIIEIFVEKAIKKDREDKIDYTLRHNFLKKFSRLVLNAKQEDVEDYLHSFIENFDNSEIYGDLFQEFILAEDLLNTYKNFWIVWELFKGKIFEICKDGDKSWFTGKIVKSFLFATIPWKETTSSWRSLKDSNKSFLKEISQKIGHCPSVLFSISKLLNDIGSPYLDDGVFWISKMLENNKEHLLFKSGGNTVHYLERIIRKYIYNNREIIKKEKNIKDNVLIILDFLIEEGSVIGYILRENIL